MRVSSLISRELYTEASEILEKWSRLEPVPLSTGPLGAEYLWALAEVEYSTGSMDEALSLIDRVIEKDPIEPKYHLLRGQLLFELGRSEDARKALDRAIDLDLEGDVSAEAMKVLDRI